jgi:hypothetical protein
MACVAVRVSLEVVLMLGLGFPEWSCRRYLGHDLFRPAARGIEQVGKQECAGAAADFVLRWVLIVEKAPAG